MELTPRDKDKLMLFTAALLAERRKAKGLKLNYPEAIALISAEIMEGAREGRTVAELMSSGAEILTRDDVMDGIPDTQSDVTIVIGPGTEIIAGEGKILTAGGIDAHIHFICPQQIEEALMSGRSRLLPPVPESAGCKSITASGQSGSKEHWGSGNIRSRLNMARGHHQYE